jgi:hypothetical protein
MILNIRINLVILFVLSLSCSCAVSHKTLTLKNITYHDSMVNRKGVIIKISDNDIFRESGNERTSRKIKRNNLQIIPLYVINNSLDTFAITKTHTEIFCNYEPVILMDKNTYYKKIRQKAGWHSAEIVIALIYYFPPTNTGITFYPMNPLGVLLPWGIYNIYKASKANKSLKNDITLYDLLDKKIAPGDTLRGFICIKSRATGNLLFRFK